MVKTDLNQLIQLILEFLFSKMAISKSNIFKNVELFVSLKILKRLFLFEISAIEVGHTYDISSNFSDLRSNLNRKNKKIWESLNLQLIFLGLKLLRTCLQEESVGALTIPDEFVSQLPISPIGDLPFNFSLYGAKKRAEILLSSNYSNLLDQLFYLLYVCFLQVLTFLFFLSYS